MSSEQLEAKFEKFIEYTKGKPFSYLNKSYRQKIFKGEISGQRGKLNVQYEDYVPHFGKPEKYIGNSHETGVGGWEMNFKPMQTYGEFEAFIRWFKTELKNAGKLFQAPGHQRIVYPRVRGRSSTETASWNGHVNETMRHIQAYIVARGILGGTGIENANYKDVHEDRNLRVEQQWDNGRGVIRLDSQNRFVEGHNSLELRAGTKDVFVQQFVEQIFSARVASGDFTGMSKITDWNLIESHSYEASELSSRFWCYRSNCREISSKC